MTTGAPGLVPSDLKVNSVLLMGGGFDTGFLASACAAFNAASAITLAAFAPASLSVPSDCSWQEKKLHQHDGYCNPSPLLPYHSYALRVI